MIVLRDLKGAMRLDLSKHMSVHFHTSYDEKRVSTCRRKNK